MVESEVQRNRTTKRRAHDMRALEAERIHRRDDGVPEIGEGLAAVVRLLTPTWQLEQKDAVLRRQQVERNRRHRATGAVQHDNRIALAFLVVADREPVGLDALLDELLPGHQTAANEKRSACSAGTIVSPIS